MKAVIMAGGFGTRLRPLTCNIPKPMVPMVNKPMMEHIVHLLKSHGMTDIVSLLFYHPNVIRSHFGDGRAFGITMQYVQAEADFGTAGSVRNAYEKLGDDRVLIISGDVLTDFDLTEALNFHAAQGADATIVLTRVTNPLQFGVVIVDDEGNITRFLEKPSWGEVFSDTINTGIYIIEHDVLDMIPYKEDFDFSKNLFPAMMQRGMKLSGYIAKGYWRDVGTLDEYREASMDCVSGLVRLDIPELQSDGKSRRIIGSESNVSPSAKVINSVIGKSVTVGPRAIIQNSVIWDGCVIEEQAQITDSVVGYDSLISAGATIAENVFISDRCRIGQQATLFPNIKLWPEKVVQSGAILTKSLVWEDRWLKELFTDSRITGTTNVDINPEFGAKIGAALGAVIGEGRRVLASRDPDNASRMIKRAIACGLLSAGVSVNDMQITPIPMVRQELRAGKNAAGFHVRKSPFDRRSMDIIFFDADGKDLPISRTKSIERQFFSEDFKRANYSNIGSMFFPERSTEYYRERFFATLDTQAIKARNFHIVVDYSFGIASSIFPNILGSLETNVVSLNAYVDPHRITRTAEEFNEACDHISGIVHSLSSDVGFLLDAGAEKLFIADERGVFIDDHRLLPIVTKLFLEGQKQKGVAIKKIGCPIGATSEVDIVAKEYDVEVVRSTTTHGGMMSLVFDDPEMAFVGGTKGGFIFPEFSFATDAMYATAKILEMLAVSGLRIGELNQSIERLYRLDEYVPCDWDAKGKVMRYAMRETDHFQRLLIDGIKIHFDLRNWVHLLPSKEFPQFHVAVEADSQERAKALVDEYVMKVGQWRDNP